MSTGGLVLALNASAVFYPDPNVKAGVEITSALLGLAVLFLHPKPRLHKQHPQQR